MPSIHQKRSHMQNNDKAIWVALFVLFMVSLPFGPALPNILSGVIMVFWLVQLFRKRTTLPSGVLWPFLAINGYVIFHIVSILWSENWQYGLEKSSTLLLIPAFYLVHASARRHIGYQETGLLLASFSISLTALVILSFGMALITGGWYQEALTQQALSTAVVDFHYLGFSLYLGICLVLNVHFLLFRPRAIPKFYAPLSPFLLLLFSITLVLLSSRTTLLVTGLILLGQAIAGRKILMKPGRTRNLAVLFLFLILVTGLSNRVLREKVKEAINLENRFDVQEVWGGRGFRELIWNCAWHVISEHPVVGVGYGDQKNELDLCYRKYRYEALLFNHKNFNAHNLFFQVTIATGSLGLLFFLLAFGFPILSTLKRGQVLYLVFVLMILGTGLTESHFNRNAIVSIFAFFNPLLWFLCSSDESSSDT